jgi:hypothetical protein
MIVWLLEVMMRFRRWDDILAEPEEGSARVITSASRAAEGGKEFQSTRARFEKICGKVDGENNDLLSMSIRIHGEL